MLFHKPKDFCMKSLTKSAYDTRSLDTLNKELLSEKIYDKQRSNNYKTACITYSCFIRCLSYEILNIQGFRNRDNVGKKLRSGTRKEQSCIEAVCPLP